MKNLFLAASFLLVLSACSEKKADKKAALDEVIKVHDKVMAADEQLEKNKMQLDSLLKQSNLPGKDTAKMLSAKLTAADSVMEKWMHNFDPEHAGKSDEETVEYMNSQKKEITAINARMDTAITASNKYLTKVKSK